MAWFSEQYSLRRVDRARGRGAVLDLLRDGRGAASRSATRAFWEAALRWGHVLVGIMWIGHLYYFNFTQIPNMPKIPEEARGPAIAKVIAPAALFWFRWGAMLTLITGAAARVEPGLPRVRR